MEEENELETKSFKLSIAELSIILQSVHHLTDHKILGSTQKVDAWNKTAITLETQGLECGWLTKQEVEPKEEPSEDKDEPVEAEVVDK